MKKCSWCGKEYSDEATTCSVDSQPLVIVRPPSQAVHEPSGPVSAGFLSPSTNQPNEAKALQPPQPTLTAEVWLRLVPLFLISAWLGVTVGLALFSNAEMFGLGATVRRAVGVVATSVSEGAQFEASQATGVREGIVRQGLGAGAGLFVGVLAALIVFVVGPIALLLGVTHGCLDICRAVFGVCQLPQDKWLYVRSAQVFAAAALLAALHVWGFTVWPVHNLLKDYHPHVLDILRYCLAFGIARFVMFVPLANLLFGAIVPAILIPVGAFQGRAGDPDGYSLMWFGLVGALAFGLHILNSKIHKRGLALLSFDF